VKGQSLWLLGLPTGKIQRNCNFVIVVAMQTTDPTVSRISWQALGTIATFLGTVLTVVVTWRKDRTASSRRIQILDEATRYVEFWKAYLESGQANCDSDEQEALSKEAKASLKMLGRYVDFTVTQPMSQSVNEIPVKFLKRQTFKLRAKKVALTFAVLTGISFAAVYTVSRLNVVRTLGDLFSKPEAELTVNTNPSGEQIFVDGTIAGISPVRFRLPPGTHRIVITQKNGKTVVREISVTPREQMTLMSHDSEN